MLLPEIKEREQRFTLALRMGLPIFALVLALISHTLITNYSSLETSFYVESLLLLAISTYFIFYLLYKGADVQIRDFASGAFTREYLEKYISNSLKKYDAYTLVLLRVENLSDINQQYGIQAGDRVLKQSVEWLVASLKKEKISNFPIGHFQGGDLILGLKGYKEQYQTVFELLSLKARDFKVEDIEVKISLSCVDTHYSHTLDFLFEKLLQTQEQEESIDPSHLEVMVIQAIKRKNFIIHTQAVFEQKSVIMQECFVKLHGENGKIIYPKTYIKVVQKLGLRLNFDIMVLQECVQKYQKSEITLAVNIAPSSLRNEKFVRSAQEILTQAGIKNIVFILAEEEYYSFTSRYNSIIKHLKSFGVAICIDRIGTYHASFLYLRELDIDMIRYDSYYSKEAKMQAHKSIIDGFHLMAEEKKLKTWIKNLQTQASLDMAQKSGIDFMQGKILANINEE